MGRPVLVALVALLAAVALAPAASAAPTLDGSFPVGDTPGRIALGPDGNVWVQLAGAKEIARVTPDGTVTEYDTPADTAFIDLTPGPSTAGGPDDRLWLSFDGGVIEWDPQTQTGVKHLINQIGSAQGIARAANGNLWVVDSGATPGLVEVDPDGVFVREVAVAGSAGREIAAGSDSRMWWADFGNGLIRATTTGASPVTADYAVGGGPQDIAAGPAGQLAYGNPGTDPQTVGRIATDGAVQTTNSPSSDPFGVAFGDDGAYWFARFSGDDLGRLATDGTLTAPIEFPAASGPRRITKGAGNTLWVSLETSKQIARITGVEAPAPGAPPPTGDGTVTPPNPPLLPPAGDVMAPVITSVRVTPDTFRVGPASTPVAALAQRRRTGTRFRFRLTEPAAVTLRIQRARRGRRSGGRCVAPTRRLRRAPRCTRWRRAAPALRRRGRAGANVVRFSGRIRGRALRPGRHRVVVGALDAARNRARSRRARFRVVSARRG